MLMNSPTRLEETQARWSKYPYAAVRATLDTTKVFRYATRSRAASKRLVEAMRRRFRSEGLRLGRRYTPGGVALWVVRRES